jgi:hypothetical protein
MLLPDLSPPIHRLEEGKMCGGNTKAHVVSPSTVKQRTQEGCHDPDREANAAENFLEKSTRCVKDATSAVTSSPVAPAT